MRLSRAAAVLLAAGLVVASGSAALAESYGVTDRDDPTSRPTIDITVTVPELTVTPPTTPVDGKITNAQLRWGLNHETGSAAFFGGCNFLSAGIPGEDGNTGSGRVWTAEDGFYKARDGAVSIHVPTADRSGTTLASFDSRCQAPDGTRVTIGNDLSSEAEVVFVGGAGEARPDGSVAISWKGTFTVAFYGGLTYWWASDPTLVLDADGNGSLTATGGGYGTSMEDQSKWTQLPATRLTLAELRDVPAATTGAPWREVDPEYLGVATSVPASLPQQLPRPADDDEIWGAFPQSFVDFQVQTGQAAYWYTSGGQRDWAKPASTLFVSYDASRPAPDKGAPGGRPGGTGGATTPPANEVLTRPSLQTRPPGAGAPAAVLPPVDVDAQLMVAAVAARTVGGGTVPGLVPVRAAAPEDPAERTKILLTGLLTTSAGAVYGFRRGWLVLPGRG